jgi:hypothetical protein
MSRDDKKRKVSPYVPQYIRVHVHEVARHLHQSDGETGGMLVLAALNDFPTMNRLAPYMWRDYARGTHAWVGHRDHDNLDHIVNPQGATMDRLTMRFLPDDWASLDALGFAFGRPVAHAAAALLRYAHDYPRITLLVAPGYRPEGPYRVRMGG